jgi:hypothetical protein
MEQIEKFGVALQFWPLLQGRTPPPDGSATFKSSQLLRAASHRWQQRQRRREYPWFQCDSFSRTIVGAVVRTLPELGRSVRTPVRNWQHSEGKTYGGQYFKSTTDYFVRRGE